MNFSVFIFKADQNHDLCMDYEYGHTAVLSKYGCGRFNCTKQAWMESSDVYALVVYNESGEMVSGIRLHLHGQSQQLPIATTINGMEQFICNLAQGGGKKMGEICGFWTTNIAHRDSFQMILLRAATAVASGFGVASLFNLASFHTQTLVQNLGYQKVDFISENDGFLHPMGGYVSTVMAVPDLNTLEHASTIHKMKMLSLRKLPAQTTMEGPDNEMTFEYCLDQLLEGAPTINKTDAVAA